MKRLCLFFSFAVFAFAPFSIATSGELINITNIQIKNLGIGLSKAKATKGFSLARLPAKVTIPPAQETVVSAAQPGLIALVTVAVGESVTAGEVLADFISPDLLELQRDLLNAEGALRLARTHLNRDKQLLAEGAIARGRWLETRTEFEKLSTQVAQSRQLLSIAGFTDDDIEKLIKTRRFVNRLAIRSPIDGVIVERMARVGRRVDELQPLFRIANLQTLWLEINVPQERLADIKKGDRVSVGDSSIHAKIELIADLVDPRTQNVMMRATLDNTSASLRPGQKVSVQIEPDQPKAKLEIPSHALVHHGDQDYVFVRTDSGFEVREVKILSRQGRRVTLDSGLEPDESIALHGVVHLKGRWMGMGGGE